VNAAVVVLTFGGLVALMLLRTGEVKIWQALIIGLVGFYLRWTPFGTAIVTAVQWLLTGLTHSK